MDIKPRYLAYIAGLAALYIIAAKLGLSLAFSVKQITSVWLPSGLALAALILFGRRLWPGIFIGAFIANLLTNEPSGVALGVAIGNTLEAVVGASLLIHIVRFKPRLNRALDVIGLVGFSAFVSTMVAASIGTTSLVLGGLLSTSSQPTAWLLWWFGDMAGILLFAPALFVWVSDWRQVSSKNVNEFVTLLLGTALVSLAVFSGQLKILGNHPQVSYLIFPFIIWAAFRFRQLGVTAVSIIASMTTVVATTNGFGPFVGSGSTQQQLIALLLYIVLMSTSGLFMAVAVFQRDSYAQDLVRQAKSLERARDKILRELSTKTNRENELKDSNDRVTKILANLLDEDLKR